MTKIVPLPKNMEGIEFRMRKALSSVLENSDIMDSKKYGRLDEIISFEGFNKKKFREIIKYDIALHPYCESGLFSSRGDCFGRRIKDWVTLLAWRDEVIRPFRVTAGLNLFEGGFSYLLRMKIDENLWHVRKSRKCSIEERQYYGSKEITVDFKDISDSGYYVQFLRTLKNQK